MAKATSTAKVNKIKIRMYRGGTGDFFILQFKAGNSVTFKMMIDCGCIKAGAEHFIERVTNLKEYTKGKIDLLVVTHEHADHINGLEKAAEIFKQIEIKKVWFSWTEDDQDTFANDLRKNYSELDLAIRTAFTKLNSLLEGKYYDQLYRNEDNGKMMLDGKKFFIQSLSDLNSLNLVGALAAKNGKVKPTMVKLLKDFNVIKDNTEVEFLEPGDVKANLPGANGIRFYVLGPPKDTDYLDNVHRKSENFEKREKPSSKDFALISALAASAKDGISTNLLPFESQYEMSYDNTKQTIKNTYDNAGDWRKIDYDYLYSAGSLAMRYEGSINNTSVVLAIQFEESERVLLFPADAELGNWQSWHDGLVWPVKINGQIQKKNAEYFLNKTVFYKIGHHLSQNGTAKALGLEMMTSNDLTVMATLDFRKIETGWLNTMPNDLLTAELIKKSQGKFYFSGERNRIMPNAKTERVTIKKAHEATLNRLNKPFDGEIFIDCEITG